MKMVQESVDCLSSTQSASQRFRTESATDYNNAAFASLWPAAGSLDTEIRC